MIQPGSVTLDGSVPPELESFYTQEIAWEPCGSGFECTQVEVPMDYDEPEGETIELAVKKYLATGDAPAGTMFVNPGGPGGSGLDMVDAATFYFSSDLLAGLDVVGFDPRGVGESEGVRCYDQAQLEELYAATYDVETDDGWEQFVADSTAYGDACLQNTGPLMEFLDTVSAAKDLDVLRGTIGEDTLTYFGFSYGTFLGATYAELFPERVGRLVLDGAVDPALSYAELTAGQNIGFERAYRAYLEDCLAGSACPFTGSVDEAWDRTVTLLEDLAANPIDSGDGREVTDSQLISSIILSMYAVDWWPTLTEAIALVLDGDATQVQLMADIAADLDEDGNYPLDEGAFRLIDCLDYPVELDRAEIIANAEELAADNTVFGPYFGYGEVGCATLPFQSTAERDPITAPTAAAPIVVIGTTRDPATPYEWAESLADQLQTGVFLGFDGNGHTAYGNTPCIDDPVDAFLLEGTVPQDGLMC